MKPGLILTHTSTLSNGLKFFDGALWMPERGALSGIAALVKTPAEAVKHFVVQYYSSPKIAWLSGPAATPRLAKKFNLEYRKRAPGGGRKALPEDAERAKPVTIWLKKAGKADLVAATKKLRARSLGAAVATMSKRTLETQP
jgi:hypothetical protein